jgi:ribosomal protein L31E
MKDVKMLSNEKRAELLHQKSQLIQEIEQVSAKGRAGKYSEAFTTKLMKELAAKVVKIDKKLTNS